MKMNSKLFFRINSFHVDKHDVNCIFIDQTEINFSWKLWVAYEPQLKTFLRKLVKNSGKKTAYKKGALMVYHVIYEPEELNGKDG
jgi:hypothetical protein